MDPPLPEIKASHPFPLANLAICRMLGYERAELLGLGVADIHPAGDLPRVEVIHDLNEDKKMCACGHLMSRFGRFGPVCLRSGVGIDVA